MLMMSQMPLMLQVVHAEANALLNKNQAHVTGAVSTLVNPIVQSEHNSQSCGVLAPQVCLGWYALCTNLLCLRACAVACTVAFPWISRA
jgi:hypothetical protein